MCSFALIRNAAIEFVRISVLIVILTAFGSLLPFAMGATVTPSSSPSLLHFTPPVILPGDPGLILPSGDDTDKFGGDRILNVAGGGMDGRFGGVEHDPGFPDGPVEGTDMCCVGGESLICGGIPAETMPCGEILKLCGPLG